MADYRMKEAGFRVFVSSAPNRDGGYDVDAVTHAYAEDGLTLQAALHAAGTAAGIIGSGAQQALAQREASYRQLEGLTRRQLEARNW